MSAAAPATGKPDYATSESLGPAARAATVAGLPVPIVTLLVGIQPVVAALKQTFGAAAVPIRRVSVFTLLVRFDRPIVAGLGDTGRAAAVAGAIVSVITELARPSHIVAACFVPAGAVAAVAVGAVTIVALLPSDPIDNQIPTQRESAVCLIARCRVFPIIAEFIPQWIEVTIPALWCGAITVAGYRIDSGLTLLTCRLVEEVVTAHNHSAVRITGRGVHGPLVTVLAS
jgi:hypothetical protein